MADHEAMRALWGAAARQDLAEARATADARSLSERAEEAFRVHILTVQELARRVSSDDELLALLDREPGASPSTRKRGER